MKVLWITDSAWYDNTLLDVMREGGLTVDVYQNPDFALENAETGKLEEYDYIITTMFLAGGYILNISECAKGLETGYVLLSKIKDKVKKPKLVLRIASRFEINGVISKWCDENNIQIINDDNTKYDTYYKLITGKLMEIYFDRGSVLFGTTDEQSDIDLGCIVDNNYDLSKFEHTNEEEFEKRLYSETFERNGKKYDVQYVRESDFIDMIREHRVFAIEALFQPPCLEYLKYFHLDTWILRQEFSRVSSNSWVKAKKKMTVEKDLDMRCGAKSLFHSIRILMFAVQIAKNGVINHYNCGILLHKEIMEDLKNGFTWEDFNKKYKPIWKEWHHAMVELCPKPV